MLPAIEIFHPSRASERKIQIGMSVTAAFIIQQTSHGEDSILCYQHDAHIKWPTMDLLKLKQDLMEPYHYHNISLAPTTHDDNTQ
jgi:hypothetical protein